MAKTSDKSNIKEKPANYTVLARRYRSTSFDDIVGQEAVAQTLRNAIERNRTAHAYLFCGTRGVGKTSMARIFAKTLNVTDELKEKEAVERAILRGEDIDVVEIDGASNRGIDNVRELIANAGLSPARSPYKIYIIDEVHMLTKESFNALLKIMEEPPSHVKFVLCTTEPHKVPATIRSRCQTFNFKNISARRIAEHLKDVLEQEGIESEEAAVLEVARQANGSMRDGLSLLDRLIAASGGRDDKGVSVATLEQTLGTPDHALVARIVDSICEGNPAETLAAAGELINHGTSIEQAIDVLAEHLRNVMVIATCGADSELNELFGEAREAAERHAKKIDAASAVHMIALCEATSRNVKLSSTPRALFDAVVVRLALTEQLSLIPALLRGAGSPSTSVRGVEKKKLARDESESDPPGLVAAAKSRESDSSAKPQAAGVGGGQGPSRQEIEEAKKDPTVAKALDLFNGTIVSVRDAEGTRQ